MQLLRERRDCRHVRFMLFAMTDTQRLAYGDFTRLPVGRGLRRAVAHPEGEERCRRSLPAID